MQKRFYGICWSDEEKCQGCSKEAGTEKHRLYYCPCLEGNQKPDPRGIKEMGAKSKDSKKGLSLTVDGL